MTESVSVLFVCMGNICRSPTAEGVFRHLVESRGLADRVVIDSAGTIGYHAGNPPDPRSAAAAQQRGYDLSGIRARALSAADCSRYDYLIAMDRDNLAAIERLCSRARPRLFLEFAEGATETEVPDPYYGGPHGFERVLDLIEAASEGLLAEITEKLGVVA